MTKGKDGRKNIKMLKQGILRTHGGLAAVLLASSVVLLSGAQPAAAQSSEIASKPAPASAKAAAPAQLSASAQAAPTQPSAPAGRAAVWQGYQMRGLSRRAEMYYQGVWGVDELRVKVAESGEMIRFNYRVLDPVKAAALNDKKFEPALYDSQAGVKLTVPELEKVGKLRQSSTPHAGITYWMAFANPTLGVKRGHRVDVVIGSFRATSLIVE